MSLRNREVTIHADCIISKEIALRRDWCEARKFLHFILPPPLTEIDLDCWKETIYYYNADLRWLLKLPLHKFWSQIIYEKSIQKSLVSFLQNAPRFFSADMNVFKEINCWDLYKETYNLVFTTFLRLATLEESEDWYISAEHFGSLLYENFLFDIPILMDLCILFSPTSHTLLGEMVTNIFTYQPKFHHDLEMAVNGLSQVFDLILGQLGLDDKQATGWDINDALSIGELKDVIEYIFDITVTIWNFLDVYPAALGIFSRSKIQIKLVEFYEKAYTYLCQELDCINVSEALKFKDTIMISRRYFLSIYNSLLQSVSIRPLFSNNVVDKQDCAEQWLEWITCVMTERHFIIDYNSLFPLQDDIDLMIQMSIPMDNTRIDYIKNGLRSIFTEFQLSDTPSKPLLGIEDQTADRVAQLAIESQIQQVKELLPDLDDVFVQACLRHYDFSGESVINAILEGNLAPHLLEIQNEAMLSSPPTEHNYPPTSTSTQDDISKKSRTKTVHFDEMRHILDDKENLKNVILECAVGQSNSEYDDEYDDTYDDRILGNEEPDADDRRSFVVPRILRTKEDRADDLEEEDEEEEPTERQRDCFVANPAELREQAEQRRLSKGGGHGANRPTSRPRDVVGSARGQGQDKDTLMARRQKNENKSRGANHNRRFQADRKRREF